MRTARGFLVTKHRKQSVAGDKFGQIYCFQFPIFSWYSLSTSAGVTVISRQKPV